LVDFAEYGYCAWHSRYFWGLRLHLISARRGLPIAAAVTGAKADERQVLLDLLDDAALTRQIAGTTLIADKRLLRPRLRNLPSRNRSPAPAAYPQR